MPRSSRAILVGSLFCMLMAGSLLWTGCAGSSAGYHARLRVINALAGHNGNVDLLINGIAVAENLGQGVQSPSLRHHIGRVRVQAVDSVTRAVVVPETEIALAQRGYLLCIVGRVGGANVYAPRVMAIEGQPPDLTAEGTRKPAAIRCVNLHPASVLVRFRLAGSPLPTGPLAYLVPTDYQLLPETRYNAQTNTYEYTADVVNTADGRVLAAESVDQRPGTSLTLIFLETTLHAYQDP